MTIDWQHFTPYSALAGGGGGHYRRCGSAAAAVQRPHRRHQRHYRRLIERGRPRAGLARRISWRLLISPWLYAAAAALPSGEIAAGSGWLAVAGLLVGVGTRLGSGCTSGHGVCGVARLAPRSLAATAVFMLLGFTTVWLMRHLLGG